MSEMVERAARAIYEAHVAGGLGVVSPGWGGEADFAKSLARKCAAAALEALREPSDAVLDAIADDEAPFVSRRNKSNPPGQLYEVVRRTNPDWREVISDDQVTVGRFATQEEADALRADLAAKWRWGAMIDAALAGP